MILIGFNLTLMGLDMILNTLAPSFKPWSKICSKRHSDLSGNISWPCAKSVRGVNIKTNTPQRRHAHSQVEQVTDWDCKIDASTMLTTSRGHF